MRRLLENGSVAVALVAAALTLFCQGSAHGRDGEIVCRSVFTLTEETVEKLEKHQPDLRAILAGTKVEAIDYLSDGLKIKAYLVVPNEGEGLLPCVIYNRGGNREDGALDEQSLAYLARIASWGYVVVASQYRGNAGGQGKEEFGGKDVNDVLSLISLLESVPRADDRRIGMYGWSRGGMMTYLALTRTDRIAAAVVIAGHPDLLSALNERPEMEEVYKDLIPNYCECKERALKARSAIYWPERLHKKTPLLLLHGAADDRVHPRHNLAFSRKLLKYGHPFRLVMFEGGTHGLKEHGKERDRLIKDWLDRYVRNK